MNQRMKKLTLQEIKQTELEILLVFDRVCREHGLKYSMCAGTLLGAVRHQGFIPWDDDIAAMGSCFRLICGSVVLKRERWTLPT